MDQEFEEYRAQEIGKKYVSDWIEVDQEMIDRFADTTRDWMFLHVDPEKAAETEFGGTIAHGFLLLSLLAPMRADTPRPRPPKFRVGLNYGFDKVRFINPVRSGKRIRGVFTIETFDEVSPGRIREAMGVEIEIEGEERLAVVATWLTMYLQ